MVRQKSSMQKVSKCRNWHKQRSSLVTDCLSGGARKCACPSRGSGNIDLFLFAVALLYVLVSQGFFQYWTSVNRDALCSSGVLTRVLPWGRRHASSAQCNGRRFISEPIIYSNDYGQPFRQASDNLEECHTLSISKRLKELKILIVCESMFLHIYTLRLLAKGRAESPRCLNNRRKSRP